MLAKGQKINDRYEIVKSIGEGGMANVYLAIDLILDRKVAVKVLRGDLAKDEKFIRRFQREAKSVSDLSHPNIVEVYDVGEEDGQYYIVMEYIEGKTLKQLINKRGALTLPEVIDIMTQLTDGLAHAHEAYIIHRDIKPQNIMILDNGLVKITDFGIAMATNATQLTQTNSVMGSVHYLPPEQASGKGSTIKSDIYSLGILMYELITGSVPFKGDNAVEIALKHMKEKIPSVRKQNPLIPQSVENIILKATAKNPRNRYDSVREMHDDLVTALERDNEKKYVFPYPENDIDDTIVVPTTNKATKKPTKEIVTPPEEINNNEEPELISKNKKKSKKPIIIGSIVLGILIILSIIYLFFFQKKDIKVPDVVGLPIEEAIEMIEDAGFKYTTVEEQSHDVEEGLVIKTSPKAGSSRKEGSTITIYESIGGKYYELEDLTGEDVNEVKARLELLGINVTVEKRTVDNPTEYKDKEDLIIDQSPKYNPDEETILEEGDSITLYVPNVVDVYPDMVEEGWTEEDARAFAEEYNIEIDVTYEQTDDYEEGKVIYQNRPAGDTIVEGITLRIKVAQKPDDPIDDLLPDDGTSNDNQADNKEDTTTNQTP